ncbi:hypothetical protein [Aliiroseovarius subalbicans]|uniref:hypothetical protein n=1 Tax=Aliiroseovarius subalbicans TaxID=2925840 RepID=UPI001F593439|nr:hypothetical protein [Aliiroseovarius subalbicans]MCI2398898.1 hypothetical protein [Aliiroseovarius subalbicans]
MQLCVILLGLLAGSFGALAAFGSTQTMWLAVLSYVVMSMGALVFAGAIWAMAPMARAVRAKQHRPSPRGGPRHLP